MSAKTRRAFCFGAAFGAFAIGALHAGDARADAKQECVRAYDETQVLRDAGKLSAARKQALDCTSSRCPGVIVAQCTQWVAQIDASTPTVVFEVKDGGGAETAAVAISLDGNPWLASLDGKAQAIDPGPHVLSFVVAGAGARQQSVQIREGEKNRKIVVSFQGPAPIAAAAVVPDPPRDGSPAERPSVGPWVVGGIGLAALVVGGILGGLTVHDYNVQSDVAQCNPMLKVCTAAGGNAESQGKALGAATTVMLVVGGVGVATAGIWLGVRAKADKPPPTSAALGLTMGSVARGSGFRLIGRW